MQLGFEFINPIVVAGAVKSLKPSSIIFKSFGRIQESVFRSQNFGKRWEEEKKGRQISLTSAPCSLFLY
jgi:hypothetical protein